MSTASSNWIVFTRSKCYWLILLVSIGAWGTAANSFAQARPVCDDNPAAALD